MSKYSPLAEEILEKVGKAGNINRVYHCMTRLRFELKNEGIVSLDELKEIKGVLGAQFKEGTLQVIIGTTVDDVYQELVKIGGLDKEDVVDENPDINLDAGRKGLSIKRAGNAIIDAFSNSMGPLVPLFVTLGMFNVIAAIIGPSVLKIVSSESDIYNDFYLVGQCIIYFLPVLVAITASKYFKANTFVAVTLAGLMIYPSLTALIAGEAGFTIFGMSVPNVTYDSQIIPILLVVWVQSYVEKFLNRIIPEALKVICVGTFTVLIMLPLEFLVLGPLGSYVGGSLVNIVLGLYATAGPIETMLVGATICFMTALGIGRPIFFACMSVLLSSGSEFAFMPYSMVIANFITMGVALGYAIKDKREGSKQLGLSCFFANLVGGVSEPILFGILLPNKKTYPPAMIGGAVAGLFMGLTKVGYYQFGPSNVIGVVGFISETNPSNFIMGIIGSVVAFAVTFAAMLVMYKTEDK